MSKWLREIDYGYVIVFGYLFIALNTFGYTFHRWDDHRNLEINGRTYIIETSLFERLFYSTWTSAGWPIYWTVQLYKP